ncbi:transmembrane protein, putative (macronuclear) [Tetrahymena thermophila SB210]|uniref:Transmembrane protein, putative n=1 Tax=Tetrahymena thermophila (strain SB210) TaxID=312017 RepID=Q23ZC4_TETTS|nr:transmembrane protein, putative [Tetrahymena thermophila SB210]EAS01933.1 transmembrane protein, putative [Tetrahymena thermophila SB210]|eukprot:XP_001022178.1 transmembrane protein, putative [Tetrahymena thermophila SB210]
MKIRGGGLSISRRILILCLLLAVISQVGLCVSAKQRTKQKQTQKNAEQAVVSNSDINQIELNSNEISNNSIIEDQKREQEIFSQQKNVRKEEQKLVDKQEKMGVFALVQKQVGILKSVYMNYYSKLTIHLGGQKDIYIAILATIMVFFVIFMTLANNKQDFPFLRNLDLQQAFQTKSHYEKKKKQIEEDEQFYNSYNLSNSNNKSINNSEGDSYLSASDYKLQRQQVDILNALEWQRMKDRALKYTSFENNPLNKQCRINYEQNRIKKIDETIDFHENNIDINDLLKELDNQSMIESKNSCISSITSNVSPQTNTIVV